MSKQINILFIGDIVGEPGLGIVETLLPSLRSKYKADFIIANGENSHEGMGLNEEIVKNLYSYGVDVITGGNHSFAKWKIYPYMKTDPNLLRPMNYPRGVHGFGYGIYPVNGTNLKIGVINLQGRTFMQAIDDPFRTAEWVIDKIKEETNIIFVDFHAEATAEKLAFAWHVDGQVSAVVGTHTHVPTNDARILPKGTGYITDSGMTGSYNSVIGMEKDVAIKRFLLGTPHKYSVANGDNRFSGVLVTIDTETANCTYIEPVLFPAFRKSKD